MKHIVIFEDRSISNEKAQGHLDNFLKSSILFWTTYNRFRDITSSNKFC